MWKNAKIVAPIISEAKFLLPAHFVILLYWTAPHSQFQSFTLLATFSIWIIRMFANAFNNLKNNNNKSMSHIMVCFLLMRKKPASICKIKFEFSFDSSYSLILLTFSNPRINFKKIIEMKKESFGSKMCRHFHWCCVILASLWKATTIDTYDKNVRQSKNGTNLDTTQSTTERTMRYKMNILLFVLVDTISYESGHNVSFLSYTRLLLFDSLLLLVLISIAAVAVAKVAEMEAKMRIYFNFMSSCVWIL